MLNLFSAEASYHLFVSPILQAESAESDSHLLVRKGVLRVISFWAFYARQLPGLAGFLLPLNVCVSSRLVGRSTSSLKQLVWRAPKLTERRFVTSAAGWMPMTIGQCLL